MSEKYSFVFTGKIKAGENEDEVKNRLASSFNMPIEKVEGIFKGRPIVVKKGVDKAVADKYFKAFSQAGAICSINPESAQNIARTAPTTQPRQSPLLATAVPSGFWRRLFAFVIDLIIIGIPGSILGWVFFDQLVRLGQSGRIIGFVIALAYFAILNSSLGKGQTFGKKLLKIEVVDLQGEHLTPQRSALRYTVFCLPHFCNGLYIGSSNMFITASLGLIIFGLGGAILYFFIFNRKNRRTVHDFVAGTIVVKAEPQGSPEQTPVWKGHFIAVGVIFVALFGGLAAFMPTLLNWGPFPELLTIQQTLMQEPDTHTVTVQSGITTFSDNRTQWFSANIISSNPDLNYEKTADHFAKVILTKHPDVVQKDLLVVNVVCGYDIGIATGWKNQSFSFSPQQWQKKLKIDNI